ncbi:MAG: 3-hydroxybutyrate dehydrogenase [Chloroflexi bacterium]|nr:3-hydroxybutyrate dehydrogenase [Chloroflexota bacterium]
MLNGKIALVTGSTSGIGLGIAHALAAQGCAVMLNGFGDHAEIERARAEIETRHGVRVMHHGANLIHPHEVYELIEWTCARLGAIDILVNNAGIQYTAAVEDFPHAKWDAILATNLSAPFHAIHHTLPFMRRNGWGRIVNTASVLGLVASVNKAAYVAAKHGLIGLTKVVALETAGSGITCNAICPGWVRTALVETQFQARAKQLNVSTEEGAHQLLGEKQPSKQFVTVEQIGQLVVFLCSDAAAQITGAALPIDGGWTAQ